MTDESKSCEVVLYKGRPFIVKNEIRLWSGHVSLVCETIEGGRVTIPRKLTKTVGFSELVEYMSNDQCESHSG